MRLVRPPLACCCALLVFAVVKPAKLIAQTSQFEGKNVVNVLFDPPVQPLDSRDLAQIMPLHAGEPLQMSTVRAAIDRLYATGHYEDIQVDAKPLDGGVVVTFITRNSWFIGNVSVSGRGARSSPNAGQLVNATRLELGQPYNESKLDEAIAGQKHLLEANGLFLASVHPVFDYDTVHQQINIRFVVDSGRRARLGPPRLLGDLRLDEERIIRATKFRRWLIRTWKPMTQTRIRQGVDGVRALYTREDRLEAKVALEGVSYDPSTNIATPTLQIDAGPRIKINTVGYSLARRHLKRLVPVFEEHAVDNDLLSEGARNIRDYLQSSGYFEAQVEFKRQNVVNDQSVIDFLINTGRRHRLVAITFRGNEYFKTHILRERMYLQPASLLQFPHGRFSEGLMKRDIQSITDLYQSNGFRDVKVTATPVDNYKGKVGDILVSFVINEGPQYFINSLQVDGIEKMDRPKVLGKLTSIEGQPFSEFNVGVDRNAILAQYSESGFPDATFEWNSKPATERYKIDVTFVVHEGDQQFVRGVVVNPSGLRATRARLIWRTIQIGAGDPLSPNAITNTQRRLYDLGVFAKVDAAVQNPEGETSRKFVLYDIEEAARYSMAIGVGAELGRIGGCQSCFDAPAGATGFSPRISFDITRNNLWGIGHRLSLQTRASTLEQRALLAYTWPRFHNISSLTLSFTLLYESSKDVRTFTYQREEASVQLSHRVSKASTLLYRFAYRRVAVNNLKISPLLIPLLSQPVRVGILSITWVQDMRDDPVDPHRGIYNTIDFGLADRVFGSQPNFIHFLGRNSTYHPIGRKLVFARSTQIGDITPFDYTGSAENAIPLAERFFGGGANSHRGFADYQAGPRDLTTGFPLGGNALFFNQTELRFPLIGDNIGGVLFHDFGNIYTTPGHFSLRQTQPNIHEFDYMVHAVGFGIRYRTPVGPLRVDLAYSINSPSFIGFKAANQQDLINAGVNPCQTFPAQCVLQNTGHFQYFFSIGQTF